MKTLIQHKQIARNCGCIMCNLTLRNIYSSVVWYARAGKDTKMDRFNRACAMTNYKLFVDKLKTQNALPEEYHVSTR
jgi:hypothetical protein